MIGKPTAAQLLDVLRRELREVVAPAVTDPVAQGSLEMADALLASLAVRCNHEIAWMHEEIAATVTAAHAVLDADIDPTGSVAAALDHLQTNDLSIHLTDTLAAYNHCGELLSRCLEVALPAGGDVRETVSSVLESRLDHEVQIRGDFSLTGRT